MKSGERMTDNSICPYCETELADNNIEVVTVHIPIGVYRRGKSAGKNFRCHQKCYDGDPKRKGYIVPESEPRYVRYQPPKKPWIGGGIGKR